MGQTRHQREKVAKLYTYHALVEALPEPLRRELQPITESLELRE